jgi:hypothetical protein
MTITRRLNWKTKELFENYFYPSKSLSERRFAHLASSSKSVLLSSKEEKKNFFFILFNIFHHHYSL